MTFFRGWTRPDAQKTSEKLFSCPQYILQFTEGSNGFITEKNILFQGYRGGPLFSRDRGVQMLISIETLYLVIFHGHPDPLSPSASAHVIPAAFLPTPAY